MLILFNFSFCSDVQVECTSTAEDDDGDGDGDDIDGHGGDDEKHFTNNVSEVFLRAYLPPFCLLLYQYQLVIVCTRNHKRALLHFSNQHVRTLLLQGCLARQMKELDSM